MAELDDLTKPLELEQLVKINEKLGKLIQLGVDSKAYLGIICDYKEDQKASDSKSRKINTCIGVVAIVMTIATIYIVDWTNFIKALF